MPFAFDKCAVHGNSQTIPGTVISRSSKKGTKFGIFSIMFSSVSALAEITDIIGES